jgi:hypothetical protein
VRYWVLGSAPHLIDYTYELFIRLQLSLFFEDFACVSCCELHALLHLQVDPYRALQAIAHTLTHSLAYLRLQLLLNCFGIGAFGAHKSSANQIRRSPAVIHLQNIRRRAERVSQTDVCG